MCDRRADLEANLMRDLSPQCADLYQQLDRKFVSGRELSQILILVGCSVPRGESSRLEAVSESIAAVSGMYRFACKGRKLSRRFIIACVIYIRGGLDITINKV